MAVLRKSFSDIKTHSGRVDQTSTPYLVYMKISCLEMEKARKGKEREGALNRVNNINARFREIEAEKARLLEATGERKAGNAQEVTGINTDTTIARPETVTQRGRGKFKLRY